MENYRDKGENNGNRYATTSPSSQPQPSDSVSPSAPDPAVLDAAASAPDPTVPDAAVPDTVVPPTPSIPQLNAGKPMETAGPTEAERETGKTETDEETEGASTEGSQAVFVEIQDNTPNVTADIRKLVEDSLPDSYRAGIYLGLDLTDQVDENGYAVVTFEIPDSLRPAEGENRSYQIMRIYTDESGTARTEIQAAQIDGYTVTMEADSSSEYVIIYKDPVPLAGGGAIEEAAAENRSYPVVPVAIAVVVVIAGAVFILKKK